MPTSHITTLPSAHPKTVDMGVPPRCAFAHATLGKRLAQGRSIRDSLDARSFVHHLDTPVIYTRIRYPVQPPPSTTLGLPPKVGLPTTTHADPSHTISPTADIQTPSIEL